MWTSCTETVEGAGVIGADGALEALRLVGAIDAVGDLSFSELVAKTRQLRQQGGTEGARARGSSPFARSTSPSKQSMLQKARLLGRRHHKDHGDINVDGSSPRRDGGRGSTLTPLHTSAGARGARGARNVGIFALTPTTGSPTTGATTDDDDDNEEGEESDDDDDNGGGWGAHTGHATAPAGGNGSTNSKQGFGASTGGVGKDRGAPQVSTIGNGGLADRVDNARSVGRGSNADRADSVDSADSAGTQSMADTLADVLVGKLHSSPTKTGATGDLAAPPPRTPVLSAVPRHLRVDAFSPSPRRGRTYGSPNMRSPGAAALSPASKYAHAQAAKHSSARKARGGAEVRVAEDEDDSPNASDGDDSLYDDVESSMVADYFHRFHLGSRTLRMWRARIGVWRSLGVCVEAWVVRTVEARRKRARMGVASQFALTLALRWQRRARSCVVRAWRAWTRERQLWRDQVADNLVVTHLKRRVVSEWSHQLSRQADRLDAAAAHAGLTTLRSTMRQWDHVVSSRRRLRNRAFLAKLMAAWSAIASHCKRVRVTALAFMTRRRTAVLAWVIMALHAAVIHTRAKKRGERGALAALHREAKVALRRWHRFAASEVMHRRISAARYHDDALCVLRAWHARTVQRAQIRTAAIAVEGMRRERELGMILSEWRMARRVHRHRRRGMGKRQQLFASAVLVQWRAEAVRRSRGRVVVDGHRVKRSERVVDRVWDCWLTAVRWRQIAAKMDRWRDRQRGTTALRVWSLHTRHRIEKVNSAAMAASVWRHALMRRTWSHGLVKYTKHCRHYRSMDIRADTHAKRRVWEWFIRASTVEGRRRHVHHIAHTHRQMRLLERSMDMWKDWTHARTHPGGKHELRGRGDILWCRMARTRGLRAFVNHAIRRRNYNRNMRLAAKWSVKQGLARGIRTWAVFTLTERTWRKQRLQSVEHMESRLVAATFRAWVHYRATVRRGQQVSRAHSQWVKRDALRCWILARRLEQTVDRVLALRGGRAAIRAIRDWRDFAEMRRRSADAAVVFRRRRGLRALALNCTRRRERRREAATEEGDIRLALMAWGLARWFKTRRRGMLHRQLAAEGLVFARRSSLSRGMRCLD